MIPIPVYTKTGPKIFCNNGNAYIKTREGVVTWVYKRENHGKIGVAACARSATLYTAKVLRSLGYDIGHEEWARDGSVGYHLAVIKPNNCFHQVRNPLDQISSMVEHGSWGFANDVIDVEGNGIIGCMQYWLKWNKSLESFCVWRYRIEDFPIVWDEFLDRIGHKKCDLPCISTDTNKRKKNSIHYSWADLFSKNRNLAQSILEKAKEYGYDVPEMGKAL